MFVFSTIKFIEDQGEARYQKNKDWVDDCEGKRVRLNEQGKGYCLDNFYHVERQWVVSEDAYEPFKKKKGRGRSKSD